MRIAILAHLHFPICEPYLGGTEMHTAVVADELVRRGHDVTLFAKAGSQTAARLVPILDRDWTPGRPGMQPDLLAAVGRAIGDIRSGSFDVVVNNSFGPLPYTELADSSMLTILHTPPTLRRIAAVVTSPDWRPGDRHAWVSVSEANTAAWQALLPEVSCVPNGIQLDRWTDSGRVEDGLAVWTGRITPEKGLREAIAAARHAGFRLEFGGPVADRAYFDYAIAPELDDQISYVGHLDHEALAGLLQRGAVFLAAPQWDEPFGLAMVEAMACGTPVATLPRGAAPEVVGAEGGAVARGTAVEDLAEALKIAHDCDRSVVRASVQRYDARLMVDRYEQILAELAR